MKVTGRRTEKEVISLRIQIPKNPKVVKLLEGINPRLARGTIQEINRHPKNHKLHNGGPDSNCVGIFLKDIFELNIFVLSEVNGSPVYPAF
jgi:hypothetical protein